MAIMKLPEYPNSDEEGGLAMGITDSSMTANAGWLCYNYDIGGDPVIHELVLVYGWRVIVC